MESKEKLNNIVLLNKLPSNIIKEAIIVLKREYNFENLENKNLKENIIKEAEDVINDFIKEQEKRKNEKEIRRIQRRYKISKFLNIFLSISAISLVIAILFF